MIEEPQPLIETILKQPDPVWQVPQPTRFILVENIVLNLDQIVYVQFNGPGTPAHVQVVTRNGLHEFHDQVAVDLRKFFQVEPPTAAESAKA